MIILTSKRQPNHTAIPKREKKILARVPPRSQVTQKRFINFLNFRIVFVYISQWPLIPHNQGDRNIEKNEQYYREIVATFDWDFFHGIQKDVPKLCRYFVLV